MAPAPRLVALVVLLSAGLAGCASSPAPTTGPQGAQEARGFAPAVDVAACERCFEPSIAALPDGRIAVLLSEITILGPDGAGANAFPRPALPASAPAGSRSLGDGILQTSNEGRLYYSNLVLDANGGFVGLHVAASDDAAASWPVNTFVGALPVVPAAVAATDRQWLGFGKDGVVYLSYAQQNQVGLPMDLGATVGTGLWVARSADGGKTFDAAVRAVPYESRFRIGTAGPPVVDDEGRVALAFLACAGECLLGSVTTPAVRVAVSTDEGKTWVQHDVATGGPGGVGFPMIGVLAGNRLVVTWWTGEGVVLSSSTDGAAWSKPEAWTRGPGTGWAGAWPVARPDGALDVVTYDAAKDGKSCAILLARGKPAEAVDVTLLADGLSPLFGRSCPSDYAQLARLPDGRDAVVWPDPDAGVVHMRVER